MAFFKKLKQLIVKKSDADAKVNAVASSTVVGPANSPPVEPDPSRFASLIALATAARGKDAEDLFPRMFQKATHHPSVVSICPPPSHGVLAEWLDKPVLTEHVNVEDVNAILGPEDQWKADILVKLLQRNAQTGTVPNGRNVYGPQSSGLHSGNVSPKPADSRLALAITKSNDNTPHLQAVCTSVTLISSATCGDASTLLALPSPKVSQKSNESADISHFSVFATATTPLDLSPEVTPVVEAPKAKISPLPSVKDKLRFRDFNITRLLKAGSCSTVVLVRHRATGVEAAMKVVTKSPNRKIKHKLQGSLGGSAYDFCEDSVPGWANSPKAVTRMKAALDEYFTIRRMAKTPGMLELLGSFHDSKNFYFVTPYYSGGDFQSLLQRFFRLPHERAQFYAAQIVLGVEALHQHGIVHRDLKPTNILVDAQGHLVIADFGLAKCYDYGMSEFERSIDPDAPEPGQIPEVLQHRCGTVDFIAPEVWCGHAYSFPVDVWATGIIVFKMLCGRLPFQLAHEKFNIKTLQKAIVRNPIFIEQWERVVFEIEETAEVFLERCLEKQQHARPTAASLKSLPFFEGIDWDGIENRTIPAPWIPGTLEYPASLIPQLKDASVTHAVHEPCIPRTQENQLKETKSNIKPENISITRGQAYRSTDDDPYPFVFYTSPLLSPQSPSVTEEPSTEQAVAADLCAATPRASPSLGDISFSSASSVDTIHSSAFSNTLPEYWSSSPTPPQSLFQRFKHWARNVFRSKWWSHSTCTP